jgi:hypothetical protein
LDFWEGISDARIKSILSDYHGRYHTIGFADLRAVSIDMTPIYSGVCRSTDSEAMNIVEVIDEVEPTWNLEDSAISRLRNNIILLNKVGKLLRDEPELGRVMAMRKNVYVGKLNVRKMLDDFGYLILKLGYIIF